METNIRIWLYDILNAIMEIDSFLEGFPHDLKQFKEDLLTKRAVERNIEIIGEALNRVLKFDADIKITNSRNIVDTRNRIIHSYESVSDDVIWNIVITHLPILKAEIQSLLEE